MLGQIVYNISNFMSSGGYISTNGSTMNSTVSSTNSSYDTIKVNIYEDLVSKINGCTYFTQMGIQAPAGTKFILDGTKEIIVGQSGIYEIGDGAVVSSLWFNRPYNYEYVGSISDLEVIQILKLSYMSAKIAQESSLDLYNKGTITYEEYTEKIIATAEARDLYIKALQGQYELALPNNPTHSANYGDLYEVIVNYKY